ncbi:MAG: helix-turn-helix transcriptional regulator [Actinobacteria bacterium]|nr:helix-turn-helix transcriptional regulator [Actinomycetota bacterium]
MNVDALPLLSVPACCQPLDGPSLTDAEAEGTASVFKALSDPTRVKIVNMLARSSEPVCVCELTPALRLAQPTVSHHLKKLVDAGLLLREQRGVWAFYRLDRDAVGRAAGILDLEGAIA